VTSLLTTRTMPELQSHDQLVLRRTPASSACHRSWELLQEPPNGVNEGVGLIPVHTVAGVRNDFEPRANSDCRDDVSRVIGRRRRIAVPGHHQDRAGDLSQAGQQVVRTPSQLDEVCHYTWRERLGTSELVVRARAADEQGHAQSVVFRLSVRAVWCDLSAARVHGPGCTTTSREVRSRSTPRRTAPLVAQLANSDPHNAAAGSTEQKPICRLRTLTNQDGTTVLDGTALVYQEPLAHRTSTT